MDEQLVDALRRRSEHGGALDVDAAFDEARATAAKRRRRRRTTVAAALACVVVLVGAGLFTLTRSGSDDHAEVAIAPHDEVLPDGWTRFAVPGADVSIGVPLGWAPRTIAVASASVHPVVDLASAPAFSSLCETPRLAAGTGVTLYEYTDLRGRGSYVPPQPFDQKLGGVSTRLIPQSEVVDRPAAFTTADAVDTFGCTAGSPDEALRAYGFIFRDHGRVFYATVATSDGLSDAHVDLALQVLDTLRVGDATTTPATTITTTTREPTPATRANLPGSEFQLRPVLGQVAPVDPSLAVDGATTRSAVASCDVARVGPAIPTTPVDSVDPSACVVLEQDGGRYLLGPAQVDADGVATAKKELRSGTGWVVDITFTANGATALDELARQQFHQQMAMVANGVLVAAPMIQPNVAEFDSFGGHLVATVPTESDADAVLQAIGRR
ncbi:MAG TPA: hypothetical protein VGN51_24135 [Acidimicrobiia bacterium]|jgi:hypothetical protein